MGIQAVQPEQEKKKGGGTTKFIDTCNGIAKNVLSSTGVSILFTYKK